MKYLSLVLLLISAACYAQIPEPALISIEGFGGNHDDVLLLSTPSYDGGYILSIQSNSSSGNISTSCGSSNQRTIFQKYSSDGLFQWEKCYPIVKDSFFSYLFPRNDGTFVVGGAKTNVSTISRGLKVRKEDANGNIIWSKSYGGSGDEFLKGMVATTDGGYVLLADSYSGDGDVPSHYGSMFTSDFWILKIDADGNIIWSKTVGGTDDDKARNIIPCTDGSYYLIGSTISNDYDCVGTHSPGIFGDAYVARIASDGNIKWHRCIGGTNNPSDAFAATPKPNGGIILAAATSATDGDVTGNKGGYDVWIIDMDSVNNNINWSKCYGSSADETPLAICMSSDSTVWIGATSTKKGGDVNNEYGDGDVWLLNISNTGTLRMSKVLGSSKSDYITVIQPLQGGVMFVGGCYQGPGTNPTLFPINHYGERDIFFAILAPWPTNILNLNTETRLEQLAPNPATDRVSLSIKNQTEISSIIITDVLGNKQYTNKQQGQTLSIDVHSWARGIYLVQLTDEAGRISYERLVLE